MAEKRIRRLEGCEYHQNNARLHCGGSYQRVPRIVWRGVATTKTIPASIAEDRITVEVKDAEENPLRKIASRWRQWMPRIHCGRAYHGGGKGRRGFGVEWIPENARLSAEERIGMAVQKQKSGV